ncbi:caffeic acid 3-O-methyltransferase-like [Impatiens glandulifera]|uniref:caffeic acid 3-O-methyltransferase-like n=1 Tax=Impatiens glandulifera TaxID=253017 RepID=UPI001FB12F88|nr:caffeic acid 3-O-methyltransferase-like [Impatiens glandulifera]
MTKNNDSTIHSLHNQKDNNEEEEEEHRAYATQLVNSIALPMTMQAAIDLNVLEIIAKEGPKAMLSPSEIADRIPCKNPNAPSMLQRMLKLLTSFSVLTVESHDGQERYGLAPVAKYFVNNEHGASLAPLMTLVQDKVLVASWYRLKDAVVEGGVAFDMENGTNAFDYQGVDPRFNDVFNSAMINHTKTVLKELLLAYKGFHEDMENMTLVDVGGGLGATLNIITSMFPMIKGINFDLSHVICHAPPYSGVEHVGGNMFESVPIGDAIFMKWILHDWSDEHCLKLLKNCYKVLPSNGKVIVVEGIVPEVPSIQTSVKSIYQLDIVMLTVNPGGKERTLKQFYDLAIKAGFAGIRLECTAFNYWIIEMYK